MKLLTPIFSHRADNCWQIDNLKVVDLSPPPGASPNFYATADDIIVAEPTYASTIAAHLGQSIVPIVADIAGEKVLRCIGTGFLISCTGLLITAAHVITDPLDRAYGGMVESDELTWRSDQMRLSVMIPTNPLFQGRAYELFAIEWAAFLAERRPNPIPVRGVDLKLTSDIAICKISPRKDGAPHQPLSIVQRGLRGTGIAAGKTAFALGYAGMRDIETHADARGRVIDNPALKLHVSRGTILERFPDNAATRSVPTPGACFSVAAKYAAGMSGGPIFDDERIYVHGVVSKGWEGADGLEELGYGSMIAPSLGLPIRQMSRRSLLDLLEDGREGMVRLHVPGA